MAEYAETRAARKSTQKTHDAVPLRRWVPGNEPEANLCRKGGPPRNMDGSGKDAKWTLQTAKEDVTSKTGLRKAH